MKLIATGLGLLLLSLIVTLVLSWERAYPLSPQQLTFGSWVAAVTLLVGAGLVVAGALLRALRPPARVQVGQDAAGADWFA